MLFYMQFYSFICSGLLPLTIQGGGGLLIEGDQGGSLIEGDQGGGGHL